MDNVKYIELIIFDLDGTLVDSKADIVDAVNFTLKKLGLNKKSNGEITSYIGTGVDDLIRKSLGEKYQNLFNEALTVFRDYYGKHAVDKSSLYPNVKEILEFFKNKKKIIITNKDYKLAVITLKSLGIYDYFENIIGGDNIKCVKPSSCPLDKVIDRFGIDREKVLIVGDMHIDILAGRNAGITTCAVTYGIGKKEDIIEAKPDYIIDDILELKRIIE